MKKLNNKGVTLVELLVSFAIVSVAVVYLFQTLYIVKKLYAESKTETNNYVDINYALRMTDELFNENPMTRQSLSSVVNGNTNVKERCLIEVSMYNQIQNDEYLKLSGSANGNNYFSLSNSNISFNDAINICNTSATPWNTNLKGMYDNGIMSIGTGGNGKFYYMNFYINNKNYHYYYYVK